MNAGLVTNLLLQFKYPFMVPASLLAGPLVGMAAGFFIRLGYLNFPISYACLMSGELIGDIIWYWLGYHYGERFVRRFGRFFSINDNHVNAMMRMLRARSRTILFLSKLTTGFGFAIVILFSSGMARIPFRRFMTTNVAGQFLWTGGLLAVGYFLGTYYVQVNNVFHKVSVISFAVIILALLFGFGKFAGKELMARFNGNDATV